VGLRAFSFVESSGLGNGVGAEVLVFSSNNIPQHPSLEIFKTHLDKVLYSLL